MPNLLSNVSSAFAWYLAAFQECLRVNAPSYADQHATTLYNLARLLGREGNAQLDMSDPKKGVK